ncbi:MULTISPECIES: asparagine synthase-related protein [Gordonia]|nr:MULTISPECIES: asparagine synthase-related protein [Gordonia]WLP89150.1 asparagine synthase-related protein [Gordonia sp. NB41Y]
MISSIESRGTVTERWTRHDLAAATRRLPIVDREHAIQPWRFGPNKRYTLCYNGEIYNPDEIRAELAEHGHTPTTESDTELVALSLITWTDDAVMHLSGEFAFAAELNGSVYVARDRLGVKPLYYAIADGLVSVASEIKALVTIDAPIMEVPPGHHGWISAENGASLRRYYDLDEALHTAGGHEFTSVDEAVGAVRSAVTSAVHSRVRTDLPIAIILSGGLDSSIVASLAAQQHSTCVAYTIGTPDSPDIDHATRLARDIGIPHRVIEVRPSDIGRSAVMDAVRFSELTEYGDIINAVISAVLFTAIAEDGIRIAVGGDCSDELFGGYPMYQTIPEDQRRDLFLHKLHGLSRTELQRVDRASMSATVEARVPFLDERVVETALRLPMSMKTRDGQEKWVLRRAFDDALPDYVINRPKHGLSYSSGLHDRIRLFKPWIAAEYRRCGYGAHGPLRRDFDAALAVSGNDLRQALADDMLLDDHTFFEKGKDLVGALRWNLARRVAKKV